MAGGYDAAWLKRHWPIVLMRWVVFAAVIAVSAVLAGQDLINSAALGILVGGLLNVVWFWIA